MNGVRKRFNYFEPNYKIGTFIPLSLVIYEK